MFAKILKDSAGARKAWITRVGHTMSPDKAKAIRQNAAVASSLDAKMKALNSLDLHGVDKYSQINSHMLSKWYMNYGNYSGIHLFYPLHNPHKLAVTYDSKRHVADSHINIPVLKEEVMFAKVLKEYIGFKALSAKLQSEGHSAESADAIAASIGRRKYGKKGFAALARRGRQQAAKE